MDKLLNLILTVIISIISTLYGKKSEAEHNVQEQLKDTQESVKKANKAKKKAKTPKDKDKYNRDNANE